MHKRSWSFKETFLRIASDSEESIDMAITSTLKARREIESFISKNPDFRWSLEPVGFPGRHPRVIELMIEAGRLAGVGPFAAVAGTLSQVAAEVAVSAGAKNVMVENGGDISISGDQDFRVGIFAGKAKSSGKLGLIIRGWELPIGICTSSGSVGHSISFGDADAAVVVADEASLADAAATSVANVVKGGDESGAIGRGLERAKEIPKIRGCLIVKGGHIGTWGRIPEIISTNFEYP